MELEKEFDSQVEKLKDDIAKQEEKETAPQIEKAPESFNSQVAGRYAKSFGRKMRSL